MTKPKNPESNATVVRKQKELINRLDDALTHIVALTRTEHNGCNREEKLLDAIRMMVRERRDLVPLIKLQRREIELLKHEIKILRTPWWRKFKLNGGDENE
jgi:hypothetical protein